MGVTNYVVCPTKLDSRGKGVNTDKTDALELLVRLDRYVAGNQKSFAVVRVPTPAQEQKRALSRQREQWRRQRMSLAAQGRFLLLGQGYRQSNQWWRGKQWEELQPTLPPWLVSQLECFIRLLEAVDLEMRQLGRQVEKAAPARLPVGLGKLTHEIIEGEMKDWNNFRNRRQVGSYAGLTGGVSGSGEQSMDLSITKAGNRRLSTTLVGPEMGAHPAQPQGACAAAQAGHCGLCPAIAHRPVEMEDRQSGPGETGLGHGLKENVSETVNNISDKT
jgi:transposase